MKFTGIIIATLRDKDEAELRGLTVEAEDEAAARRLFKLQSDVEEGVRRKQGQKNARVRHHFEGPVVEPETTG